MSTATLTTEKHRIEQEFHDRWAQTIEVDSLLVRESFEACTAVENRFALENLLPLQGKRILDLGCGAGETSVYFALRGAQVTAVDISPEIIQVAQRLAQSYEVALDCRMVVAESLPFEDASFDAVFGNGVLHHVELLPALREVRRVLKPGGRAIFVEPLKHNPVISLYRRLAADNRTPTEYPLGFGDFDRIRSIFPRLNHREFWLCSLYLFVHFYIFERLSPGKVRYWKKVIEDAGKYETMFRRLKRMDDWLLRRFPFLGQLCWNTVLIVDKAP